LFNSLDALRTSNLRYSLKMNLKVLNCHWNRSNNHHLMDHSTKTQRTTSYPPQTQAKRKPPVNNLMTHRLKSLSLLWDLWIGMICFCNYSRTPLNFWNYSNSHYWFTTSKKPWRSLVCRSNMSKNSRNMLWIYVYLHKNWDS